jgi:hypothetical protein
MPDSESPPVRGAEPVPVQLTRMEGILNLIAFRTDQVVARVDRLESVSDGLTLKTQRLADDALASRETALSLAKALKEADEARRDKSEQTWSPITRVFAVIAAIATVASVVAAFAR